MARGELRVGLGAIRVEREKTLLLALDNAVRALESARDSVEDAIEALRRIQGATSRRRSAVVVEVLDVAQCGTCGWRAEDGGAVGGDCCPQCSTGNVDHEFEEAR